jgi:hypothetical protein
MIFASVDASILQLLCWVTDARQQATHCKQHLEQALSKDSLEICCLVTAATTEHNLT